MLFRSVALLLCLAFTGLLLPSLNRLYFDIFLLPLYAVCGLLVADSFRKSDRSVPVRQTIFQLATFLGTFALVTAIWIIPLARALGVRNTPWHLFIGRVNTAALIYPLIAPSPLFPAMVILLAAPLLTMALRKPYNRRTGALIGIFVLVTVAEIGRAHV